ncbi:hypothetical protein FOZ61_001301 [Perkinsus olseni]|uniref:Uncharacterized protein n=1 Tax=Perkinsus olseni TaxID=32597 RepID=A0A7J6LX64_PEROL|nr:hypothetical protein FOZ61_001301 [Perkinsus olseni]
MLLVLISGESREWGIIRKGVVLAVFGWVEMVTESSRRSAMCLRLRALNEASDSSESGLLWSMWLYLATPRPTVSPLYTVQREGYVSGVAGLGRGSILLSSEPGGEGLRTISDHDMTDANHESGRCCVLCASFSNGQRLGVLPPPPGAKPYYNLSETFCVSNGQLFMVGYGDGKVFKMVLPPPGDYLTQAAEVLDRNAPKGSVEWVAVADLPSRVTDIDVIARDDDSFQLVCAGHDGHSGECYIYLVDHEGKARVKPHVDARMCKLVPSSDELVCVAACQDSDDFAWSISLVDIWCMSVVFSLDALRHYEGYPHDVLCNYMTITEDGLVVIAQQKDRGLDAIFELTVYRLQLSIG